MNLSADKLKAYHVQSLHGDSDLLVFAPTASKAKALALRTGLWDYVTFCDIRARRAQAWDGWADHTMIVETNDDLREGAPPFYRDGPEELILE